MSNTELTKEAFKKMLGYAIEHLSIDKSEPWYDVRDYCGLDDDDIDLICDDFYDDLHEYLKQDNWIPIEDKSQLFDGLRCIIQDTSNDVFEAVYNNKIWCHTFNNDHVFSNNNKEHVKYYQPLPEPKNE